MFKEIFKRARREVPSFPSDARPQDFNREVEKCLEFFDSRKTSEEKKYSSFRLHGSKVSVGVTAGNKLYYIEKDLLYDPNLPPLKERYVVDGNRVIKTRKSYVDGSIIGNSEGEVVTKDELKHVIGLLRHITIPYNEHISSKNKHGK